MSSVKKAQPKPQATVQAPTVPRVRTMTFKVAQMTPEARALTEVLDGEFRKAVDARRIADTVAERAGNSISGVFGEKLMRPLSAGSRLAFIMAYDVTRAAGQAVEVTITYGATEPTPKPTKAPARQKEAKK